MFSIINSFYIKKNNGYQSLIGSALAFSLMSVCVKKLDGNIPVAEIVFFRAVISLLITYFQIRIENLNPWGHNKKLLLIRGLFGTLALYCVFRAISKLPISSATIIQYCYPTFTAIGASLILKECIKKKIWLAIGLGWAGICLVVQPSWEENLRFKFTFTEITIALAGAILTSFAYLCVKELSKKEHELTIIFYFPLVSVFLIIPFLFKNYIHPSTIEWIWIICIGLFTQIGQILITKGLSLLPASKAVSINYIQVIFATVWGLLFFGEGIDFLTILGGICILVATIISLNPDKKYQIIKLQS